MRSDVFLFTNNLHLARYHFPKTFQGRAVLRRFRKIAAAVFAGFT
jgi:hypothetical protein